MKSHELTVEGVRFSYGPLGNPFRCVFKFVEPETLSDYSGEMRSGKSTLLQIIFGTLDSPDKILLE